MGDKDKNVPEWDKNERMKSEKTLIHILNTMGSGVRTRMEGIALSWVDDSWQRF